MFSFFFLFEYYDMLYVHLCDVDAYCLISPHGLGTKCAGHFDKQINQSILVHVDISSHKPQAFRSESTSTESKRRLNSEVELRNDLKETYIFKNK